MVVGNSGCQKVAAILSGSDVTCVTRQFAWRLAANELARPLARLKAMDNNGLLRRTLAAWFRHNVQPLATSKALFIHRNTLEYRLNRISELTGLDLGNFDDRLLLYVALQLDEER